MESTNQYFDNQLKSLVDTFDLVDPLLSQLPDKSGGASIPHLGELYPYLDITAKVVVKSDTSFAEDRANGGVVACAGRWITVKCCCNDGEPRIMRLGGCMREDCIECSDSIRYRRTEGVLMRLNAKRGDRPIMQTSFTVPLELRDKAVGTPTWQYWRKEIVKYLKRECGFEYGMESSHPCGEDDGIFHPHLNFLWIQKPCFRRKLDLLKLRSAWAKIVRAEKEVVVYHKWHHGDRKIRHLTSYTVRPFPGWKFWRGTSIRWYGQRPKNIGFKHCDWICPECGEKIEILGFFKDDIRVYEPFDLGLIGFT